MGMPELKLEGRVIFAAPILELVNSGDSYTAKQTIRLEVKPNGVYAVKGQLGVIDL